MGYTNQSAFDLVAAHIFGQGKRASKGDHACVYISADSGDKCAVGCLLTDEQCRFMDNHGDGDIITLLPEIEEEGGVLADEVFEKLSAINLDLLAGLQTCHDHLDNWEYTKVMRDALRTVGYRWQLDVSCLEGMHFGDR